mgnify:CR=1 FL=1
MTRTVIEELIEQSGFRIERIAVALDLSNQGVRDLLAQKSSPRFSYVLRLSQLLEVDMAEIVDAEGCWRLGDVAAVGNAHDAE